MTLRTWFPFEYSMKSVWYLDSIEWMKLSTIHISSVYDNAAWVGIGLILIVLFVTLFVLNIMFTSDSLIIHYLFLLSKTLNNSMIIMNTCYYEKYTIQFDKRTPLKARCYGSVWGNKIHWSMERHEHIEAEIKWTSFRRRYFQMHFLEWKCLNSD